jgi:hypothetical protein
MIRDVPGQEDEAAVEFGVSYGLEEGETLPTDVEELTEAQYSVFCMMQTLKGTLEDAKPQDIKGEAGSGLIVPN